MSRYEEEEENAEGGQDVEVQQEGDYLDEEQQQQEAEGTWAPAEPAGRDASPSRLELRAQGRLLTTMASSALHLLRCPDRSTCTRLHLLCRKEAIE